MPIATAELTTRYPTFNKASHKKSTTQSLRSIYNFLKDISKTLTVSLSLYFNHELNVLKKEWTVNVFVRSEILFPQCNGFLLVCSNNKPPLWWPQRVDTWRCILYIKLYSTAVCLFFTLQFNTTRWIIFKLKTKTKPQMTFPRRDPGIPAKRCQ